MLVYGDHIEQAGPAARLADIADQLANLLKRLARHQRLVAER
jgi:hypothetical protein